MPALTTPRFTTETIPALLQQAKEEICAPDGRRCAASPSPAPTAATNQTENGLGRIGLVLDTRRHGAMWTVWARAGTGERRFERVP